MCDRWNGPHSFEAFLADVGPRPSPKHSIDRINNDGNYEPGNVRWATQSTQILNSSICKLDDVDRIQIAHLIIDHGYARRRVARAFNVSWKAAQYAIDRRAEALARILTCSKGCDRW